ncbi:ABC1 kinase family protein [Microbacterium sp. bgisy189]|uniref:ABC1 kinase family protein n=1 Tax=Microbacterium sp. bgisy189 TaxID=3413798 RepID=UPI003EC032FB
MTFHAAGDTTTDEAAAGRTRARYRRILRFAAWHLIVTWWFELFLPRIGFGGLAARGRPRRLQRIARRFHALAVDLGGLMIKVGQYMSSRLDVLPPEFTAELAGLQDEVPAVPFGQIEQLAAGELGMPLARAFTWIDEVPVAAASLGQAHRARLSPTIASDVGFEDVVVKVQRPGIQQIVDVDLAALRRVARWLSHVHVVASRVDMPALMEEFAKTSLEEVDYIHEAEGAEKFAADVADDARVEAPAVVWEYTTRRVLTLADVTAIKITDVDALRAAGIDPAEVAAVFAPVMFDQVFTRGRFHADPHPGNIFVTPEPGGGWHLTFVDFGMMGEVSPRLRAGLRRLMIAAAARDGKALVDAVREVGVLLPGTDTTELQRALTQLFARFGGMGFAELREVDPREFRAFADEFGDMVRTLPVQLPDNFLLIMRAMSLTSGVCSSLDARFNLWDAVEPYAARLLREESAGIIRDTLAQAMSTAATLMRMPGRLDDLLTRIDEGRMPLSDPRADKRASRSERLGRRVLGAVLFAGLLVAGAVTREADAVLGAVLMWSSAVPGLYAVFGGALGRR